MAFLFRRKDSSFWQIGWYDRKTGKKGKPVSTKTKNKKEAEAVLRSFEKDQERLNKRLLLKLDSEKLVRISDVLDLYIADKLETGRPFSQKTIERYKTAIDKYFIPAVGDKKVHQINKTDYSLFIQYMTSSTYQGKPISQNTMAVYSKCIYALFTYLVKEKYIDANPMKRVQEIQKEFTIISSEEIKAIRQYTSGTKYDSLVTFLILSAFRINEALKLKFEDIKDGEIRVLRKASKYDSIPVLPEMEKFLSAFDLKKKGLVFGGQYRAFHQFWKRMLAATGLRQDIVPHDIRKYTLSQMANAGVPINFVMQYAGHSEVAMTLKYYVRNDKAKMLQEISEKVKLLE